MYIVTGTKLLRYSLGLVVDQCARCQTLRYFHIARRETVSHIYHVDTSLPTYAGHDKTCLVCGASSYADPGRYAFPFNPERAEAAGEDAVFQATNPALKARMEHIERLRRAGQQPSEHDPAACAEVVALLLSFEAAGYNTEPALGGLIYQLDYRPEQITALLDQLRAFSASIDDARKQARAARRSHERAMWLMMAFGAAAGGGVAALTYQVHSISPWLITLAALLLTSALVLATGRLFKVSWQAYLAALIPALVIAGAGALLISAETTVTLHVDNASAEPIVVFVDEQIKTVEPNTQQAFYVDRGADHAIGWGPFGASKPVDTQQTVVNHDMLYNPGQSGCYWLQLDIYSAHDDSIELSNYDSWGPQPPAELYSFGNIDNWFVENPRSVELPSGQSSARRTALLRDETCMYFARCTADVRRVLQVCRSKALKQRDVDGAGNCVQQARESCEKSGTTELPEWL